MIGNMHFVEYMKKYPHNNQIDDEYFMKLIYVAYGLSNRKKSRDEFVDECLGLYGGTVAEAMIDYINNHVGR